MSKSIYMRTKPGKAFKLKFNKYKVEYGYVINPVNGIYINISTWYDKKNPNIELNQRFISLLTKKTRQIIYNYLSSNKTIFNKNIIIANIDDNFSVLRKDISTKKINQNKRTFIDIEISLILNDIADNKVLAKSEEFHTQVNEIIKNILTNVFDKDENFNFYLTKKDH